jgi:hypothetical protein
MTQPNQPYRITNIKRIPTSEVFAIEEKIELLYQHLLEETPESAEWRVLKDQIESYEAQYEGLTGQKHRRKV